MASHCIKKYCWPNGLPHFVSCSENGLILCDSNCLRYNSQGFCGHSIAVALKNKTIQSFTSALSKYNEETTSMASQKIKRNVVGCKVLVCFRKPPLVSPEKFYSSVVVNTAIKTSDTGKRTIVYDLPKTNNLNIMKPYPSWFLQELFSNPFPGLPSSSSVKY